MFNTVRSLRSKIWPLQFSLGHLECLQTSVLIGDSGFFAGYRFADLRFSRIHLSRYGGEAQQKLNCLGFSILLKLSYLNLFAELLQPVCRQLKASLNKAFGVCPC